jgi:hypothetical protein
VSSIELVTAYLTERARPMVFVPLALLIAEAAWLAAPDSRQSVAGLATRAVQALLLVLALRVWDDLQDRKRDAVRHPDRVTVRFRRAVPLVGLGVAFAIGGVVCLAVDTVPRLRITLLVGIAFGLLAWYRLRPAEPSRVASMALLAKYPALAIVLAPGLEEVAPVRATLAAATLYVVACTYELMEDRHRGVS